MVIGLGYDYERRIYYPPSFSLGITQLDATVEDIPFGFVPAIFDEQDPDWAKNQSNNRNDPVTMKKLRDKAASKSKKSTSKASKKKFDDSGRPHLPKHKEAPISVAHFQIVEDDRYIHFPWGKHSYKNIQPTTEEVSRLNLSFSKDFETCDPTTYTSIFDSGKLKRTADEVQQRVGTIAEEFDDFSTILPRKILIKADFASPSHQHKFVPSSSTQPEGTSKSSLDDDEIKNYINKCHEDYDKGSLNDMKMSRDEESNKQHILEEQQLLVVNAADKEAGREDDFKNEDCSDLQALENVNVTVKEDVNEVNLKNQESTDVTGVQDEVGGTITDSIQAVVDTILFDLSTPSTTKSLDVQELQASKVKTPVKRERKKSRVLRSPYISKYDSGSKDAGDFDKVEKLKYAFDGYTINQDLPNELMIDNSQWIAVGLLKTHSAKKETDNYYRVNASGLGYRQLNFVVAHPQSKNWFYLMFECKTCWNDEIQLGDNYRYMMINSFFKTYVEKTHTRYYPAKPEVEISTQQDYAKSIMVAKNEDAIANIIHGFCMLDGLLWYMVDEVYVSINCGKEFHWVLNVIVLKERLIRVYDSLSSKRKTEPPIEIQKLAVMLPTYLSDNDFYNKTERTDWPSLEAYKGKITQQTGLVNEIPFDVDYVQNIPQQASYNCGIFVYAYTEILSEGLQVHSCGFDAASQRACYASLLWHYGVKRTNEGYTSDNGDPPRPRKNIIEEIDASAIVTLE
ncbi:hypothetical protein CQW23_12548 [Capsicum baccatum]|uniref:Ubiquitin-like protease family profile domain-containing protein n=1 Tax=Capsicum baccatum TaxID=33114 RepID=A0A2G2WT41_CAPBA|nr:hypothetical protein CQW23_12548 [Capsicum baccatum]